MRGTRLKLDPVTLFHSLQNPRRHIRQKLPRNHMVWKGINLSRPSSGARGVIHLMPWSGSPAGNGWIYFSNILLWGSRHPSSSLFLGRYWVTDLLETTVPWINIGCGVSRPISQGQRLPLGLGKCHRLLFSFLKPYWQCRQRGLMEQTGRLLERLYSSV